MSANIQKGLILGANLSSAAAAILMNIALASVLHEQTQSATMGAAVIIAAYLPPLFFGTRLGAWIDRHLSRRTLLACEFAAAAVSVLSAVVLKLHASTACLLALMALRAIASSGVRGSLIRWLKIVVPRDGQGRAIQLFQVSMMAALTLSGFAAMLASRFDRHYLEALLLIDLTLYSAAICIYTCLPSRPGAVQARSPAPAQAKRRAGQLATYREILSVPDLGRCFAASCMAQAFFQAAEQVIVSLQGSAQGDVSTGALQVAAGIGLLGGFAVIWWKPEVLKDKGRPQVSRLVLAFLAGSAFLLLTTQSALAGVPLPAFVVAILLYEMIDLYSYSRFFQLCPEDCTARYSLSLNMLGGAGMSVTAFGYALMIDQFGFNRASLYYTAGCIFAILLAFFVLARLRPEKDGQDLSALGS